MSHSWKNILVAPTSTVNEVLKVIDSASLKLALVVDGKNKLLGTVTDGDIRRALINGESLSTHIVEIMFSSPTISSCPRKRLPISTSRVGR